MSEPHATRASAARTLLLLGLLAAGSACAVDRSKPVTSWDAEVERARAHLATELGPEAEQLEVKRIERMQWSDSSLGCPQPGKAYLPVITDGVQVTFLLDKHEYRVNLAGETAVSCERSRSAKLRKAGRQTSPAIALYLKASKDLAERLGVSRASVRLVDADPVLWAGDAVSCESVEADPGEIAFKGYRIIVSNSDVHYVYKCSDDEAVYCGPASEL